MDVAQATAEEAEKWCALARSGNQGIAGVGPQHAVARIGDAAPGTSATFQNFTGSYSINANGRVAFQAALPAQPDGPGGV